MTNCSLMGDGLAAVHSLTAQVDAFTVSCAKEALVPDGALACVRDDASYRRLTAYATQAGTILSTADSRARLAAALAEVPHTMDRFVRRKAQVEALARALAARGVTCIEPVCGHAVWVPVTSLVVGGDPSSARGLEAQLYIASGVLAGVWKTRVGEAIRLAVPIDSHGDAALDIAVDAIHALFERRSEAPQLEMVPGESRGDVRAHFRRRTP
jgi:tryptophanase